MMSNDILIRGSSFLIMPPTSSTTFDVLRWWKYGFVGLKIVNSTEIHCCYDLKLLQLYDKGDSETKFDNGSE